MADCGLLNFATCLPQALFEYFLGLLNAIIQPLLTFVKGLLSEPIQIDLFVSLWAIIIYILSMFYAFLILYSGFNFIISGYDSAKREKAKDWLRNTIIMIVLVQASFFLYDLVIQLSSVMTSAVINMIDANFFLLTVDNLANVGLEISLFLVYVLTLLLTSLMLVIRYAIVAIGVVLFPMAIFFYFVEPLKPYGVLILNFLGVSIFVTFIDAIVLIGFSKLIGIALFANFKILVMISAFLCANALMFFLVFFSLIKAGISVGNQVVKVISTFK